MRKWAIPLAAAALMALVAVAGATFALTDSGDDDGSRVSRDADDRGESGGEDIGDGVDAVCLEGAIDCDDTIDTPADPDVCIQIYPTPPECTGPDQPVSDEPPPTSDPSPACTMEYPNECMSTRLAVADLADRLDVSEEQITVKSMEFVQWPDSCLGVAQPDVACAEVITPGYRLVLEASGETYEYHTDGGSRVVLVE